ATVTDKAGNESAPDTATATVGDTTAPNAPTVDTVTNTDTDNDGSADTTTITGKAEPDSVITVTDSNGNVIGETTTDTDGNYEVDVPVIADGDKVEITATDKAGNESDPTEVTGDTTAPDTPTAPTTYNDDAGATQSADSSAPVTDDTTPGIVVGTGLTDTPKLYVDGQKVAATYDAQSGTLTPDVPLAPGAYEFTYTLTDAAGNESDPSDALAVTINTERPTITVSDDVDDAAATNGVITFTLTPSEEITGLSEDDLTISNGSISSYTQNPDGTVTVVVIPDTGIEGEVRLSIAENAATAVSNGAGTQSAQHSQLIDTKAPGQGEGAEQVQPLINIAEAEDGLINNEELNSDTAPQVAGIQTLITLPSGTVEGDTVTLTITDDQGFETTVEHTVTATEEAAGTSRVTIPNDASGINKDGDYTVEVTVTDAAGNTSTASEEIQFTVDTTPPAEPTALPIVKDNVANDGSGNVLDPSEVIADGGKTNDNTPSITVPADQLEEGDIPQLVVDGEVVPATAVTNPDGSVTLTPETPLEDGNYKLSYNIKDAAGNISRDAPATTVDVDTTAPDAPQSAPVVTDNVANDGSGDVLEPSEVINDGDKSNDNTPSVTVPADQLTAGDTPQLVVDGVVVPANIVENADGSVTLTPTTPLNDGIHELSYNLKDSAGNVSGNAPTSTVDVDTVAPAAPTVTPNANNGSVTVSPSADAKDGDVITIKYTDEKTGIEQTLTLTKNPKTGQWVDGNTDDTVVIDPVTGEVFIPQDAVQDGSEVTATQTDAAGNVSVEATGIAGTDVGSAAQTHVTAVIIAADGDNDGDNDGYINAMEKGSATTTEVTVKLTNATIGETLTLTDGTTTYTKVIDTADVDAGSVTFTGIDIPADGETLTVKASITNDANGNVIATPTTSTATAIVDITAPAAPTVTPNQDNGSVTVAPSTDAKDGDVITITYKDEAGNLQKVTFTKSTESGLWGDGNTDDTVVIDPATGVVTIPQDAVQDGSEVTATQTDAAGNASNPVTGTAGNDVGSAAQTHVTAVIIAADGDNDGDNDGYINAMEKGSATTTEVTVKLTNATIGETLTLTDGTTTYTKVIDTADVDAGSVTFTGIAIPADGEILTVKASITNDANGNVIAAPTTGTATVIVDITAPTAPTVTPNANNGSVTVSPSADAKDGDVIT
ncbi:Ig-like domain-containing protein, partial [Psychrobacter sanguinis]